MENGQQLDSNLLSQIQFESSNYIMKILIRHFDSYKTKRPWPFCLHITMESFFIAFIFIVIFSFFGVEKRSDVDISLSQNIFYMFIFLGIFLPIFETFLLQLFPVFIMRVLKKSFAIQLFSAWIPFALLHFYAGLQVGILAGLIRGFYLAYAYVYWVQSSKWNAFWITSVSHMITNIIIT